MSGFEIVGVVLGAIPLFVEFGKAATSNASAARRAISPVNRDDQLRDFYIGFYKETVLLHQQVVRIIDSLPLLSEDRKAEVKRGPQVDNWTKETDLFKALEVFFSPDDLSAFLVLMERLLKLFARLVKDKRVHLSQEDKNNEAMGKKLATFIEQQEKQATSSTFWERFRFLKKDSHRHKYLQSLREWNRDMDLFIQRACEAAERKKAVPTYRKPPSSQLRTLSQRLFATLSRCWTCQYSSQHEARFSLESCGKVLPEKEPRESGISFDFLVSQLHVQGSKEWLEAKVTIKASQFVTAAYKVELKVICDAIRDSQHSNDCLQLLVEDYEARQQVWQLNWKPSHLKYLQSKPVISFEALLQNSNMPSLFKRRKLAKILAYSLFQLYESPWLSGQWDNDHLHFFFTDQGKLDLEHPFLSTSFDKFPSGSEPLNAHCFHPNLGILKLGILLIEVHKWQPIKAFQTPADLVNGKPTINTDMQVAERTLTMLDDCYETYQGAIRGCIRADWAPAGSRVSLEDLDTWNAVYKDVIEPLEIETMLAGASLADLCRIGLLV